MSPYSRSCGRHTSECAQTVCTCANEPHTPTQAEREAFWEDEPVRTTPERSEAGREPHSKPRVARLGLMIGWVAALYCCQADDEDMADLQFADTWVEAMDAAHAHVREHHALTSANHTPTWQPCGRGICAAEAGHEGTCEEASGFYDWTPEFYDDDLFAYHADQSARITVTYTRDDPDPSTETWRELLAASREDV